MSQTIKISKSFKGFTLVELVLYVSISSILLLTISVFLGTLIESRIKNNTLAEVDQQGVQAMQILTRTLRNAEGIITPTVGNTSSSLTLDVFTSVDDSTVFDLLGGQLRITEGSGDAVPLTNTSVVVSDLIFENLSKDNTSGVVRVEFTLTYDNSLGRSEYNFSKSFFTSASLRGGSEAAASSDTTAPSTVSNLALGGATASSLDLSWTAPGDDGASGTATSYDVRYSTALINDGNFSSATAATGEPTPSVAGTSEAMTVSGLSPSTTYYFALKTLDEVPNVSALSNVPNFSTTATLTQADDLTVNVASASIGGGGDKELREITLENTGTGSIVVDKITVTWTNGQLIQEIKIDGTRVWKHSKEGSPDGRQPTGTEIDIVDHTIASGVTDTVDKFKFNGDMGGDTFMITFEMGDSSTKVISNFSP